MSFCYPYQNLNVPVRAPPPIMPEIGFLTQMFNSKIYALYGTRSNCDPRLFEYSYSSNNPNDVRIKLVTNRGQELHNGDQVVLPGSPGTWIVNLHPSCYTYCHPY